MGHYRLRLLGLPPALLLGLPGLLIAQESPHFTNFTFGPLCDSTGVAYVCTASTVIEVSGDSRCVDSGAVKACTRYGFSFDYDLPTSMTTLACRFESSIPQNHVSPDSIILRKAEAVTYDLDLPSQRGHYVSGQYTLLVPGLQMVVRERQTCAYGGMNVFDIEYRVIHGSL